MSTWQVYITRTTGKATEKVVVQTTSQTVCIGRIPIMVKSRFCHLSGLVDEKLRSKEDCAFDIGGYFIIKGSEKVRNTSSWTYHSMGRVISSSVIVIGSTIIY